MDPAIADLFLTAAKECSTWSSRSLKISLRSVIIMALPEELVDFCVVAE